jgi:hypothetical protein
MDNIKKLKPSILKEKWINWRTKVNAEYRKRQQERKEKSDVLKHKIKDKLNKQKDKSEKKYKP